MGNDFAKKHFNQLKVVSVLRSEFIYNFCDEKFIGC